MYKASKWINENFINEEIKISNMLNDRGGN